MSNLLILGILIFIVAITMTMVGKGGGNFYVVILAIANIPMHQAAATGQLKNFGRLKSGMLFKKIKQYLGH